MSDISECWLDKKCDARKVEKFIRGKLGIKSGLNIEKFHDIVSFGFKYKNGDVVLKIFENALMSSVEGQKRVTLCVTDTDTLSKEVLAQLVKEFGGFIKREDSGTYIVNKQGLY